MEKQGIESGKSIWERLFYDEVEELLTEKERLERRIDIAMLNVVGSVILISMVLLFGSGI